MFHNPQGLYNFVPYSNSPARTLIDCTCQPLIFTQTVNLIIKPQLSMKMAGDIQTFVNLTDLMVPFMGQASLANQADAFYLQLTVASKLRQNIDLKEISG